MTRRPFCVLSFGHVATLLCSVSRGDILQSVHRRRYRQLDTIALSASQFIAELGH